MWCSCCHRLKTHTYHVTVVLLRSSLPAPVLNGRLKHSMRCFCALETQDILPEEPYHSFPLKTAINEPIHTHFPWGNYVRFTWDILTGCSTPRSPVRAHTVLILFAATWISVQLSAYQGTMWAAFATESWACWQADHRWWRFALPPLVLSTWGGNARTFWSQLTDSHVVDERTENSCSCFWLFSSSVILVLAMHLAGYLILWVLKQKAQGKL